MLVLRPPAATKVAPRTRERTGLHLPKVRALGRPSHRSQLNDSARNAGTPPAAANIAGWCAKEPKGANDDQSSAASAIAGAVAALLIRRSELHRLAVVRSLERASEPDGTP